jgi:archaellum component FlaG (FlaF/FlaG flagellin family)
MNIHTGLRLGLILGAMGMLAACLTACNDDDPETGELDGYFERHPYVSDPRVSSTKVVSISPDSTTVNSVGAKVIFSASGGRPPYHWDVSNESMGSMAASGGAQGVYTALAIGVNDVIVYDEDGNAAIAKISGTGASSPAITPSSVTLSADNEMAVLKVTGGTAPYTWTVTDPDPGNFPSGNTGVTVVYKRKTSGDNAVTVTDNAGKSDSIIISQP